MLPDCPHAFISLQFTRALCSTYLPLQLDIDMGGCHAISWPDSCTGDQFYLWNDSGSFQISLNRWDLYGSCLWIYEACIVLLNGWKGLLIWYLELYVNFVCNMYFNNRLIHYISLHLRRDTSCYFRWIDSYFNYVHFLRVIWLYCLC